MILSNEQDENSYYKDQFEISNENYRRSLVGFEYPKVLFDSPPTANQAKIMIFSIFFIVGITQGYQAAIVMELQEKGCTYSQQAFFSLGLYPFSFRILFAPVLDIFYIKSIGKCKSWVFGTCTALFTILTISAIDADSRIHPDNYIRLTLVWLAVNMLVLYLQVAAEVWATKIFDSPDDTARSANMVMLGYNSGMFAGLNVFVPLSDLDWLNRHIFTGNRLDTPIMNHTRMHVLQAIICLTVGMYVLMRVAEKRFNTRQSSKDTACQVLNIVPKIFANKNLRLILYFICAGRLFSSLVMDTMPLKLIDHGIKKTTLVNLGTYTFPLLLVSSYVFMRIMKQSHLMRQSYYLYLFGSVMFMVSYLIYIDLKVNSNIARTGWLLLATSIIGRFQLRLVFIQGFFNTITQEAVASTFISFMMCWTNSFEHIPSTIGLRIVGADIINYDVFVFLCLLLELCMIVPLYKSAKYLDSLRKSDFAVVDERTSDELTNMDRDGSLTN